MTITAADLVVPYITAREGEEADSLLNLNVRIGPDRRPRLGYKDEAGPDRDLRGVLWARYSMSLGFAGQPTGNPRWRLVHPLRQRITMALLRCQVCTVPLKRSDGILFVETADDGDDYTGPVKTAQPPVCLEHARMAARRCPRLRSQGHVALLATRFPLYGVIGTPYQYTADGIQPLAASDAPLPYDHPQIDWFLASQLAHELRDYEVVSLDEEEPLHPHARPILRGISRPGRGGRVGQPRTMLAQRISEQRAGVGNAQALVGEMRRTVLLVPSVGPGLWSARSGGVRWICAFTDDAALARFAIHHGQGDRLMDYVALLGARIVDEIVPALDEPGGLAVDIANEDGAMFFPPVTGIVPDSVAVDAGATEKVRSHGH